MSTPIAMSDQAETPAPFDFEKLLSPISGQIRGYVYRMVGNRTDSEDLFQDTVKKAYERRAQLQNTAAFKGWLFRIATSTCLDFLRKKKRWSDLVQKEIERECHEDPELEKGVVDATQDPEFSFDAHAHISLCFLCIGRSLPPEQQAALVLREFFGFTNQEAASILQIGEGKLRHALSDGRRAMEESFEGLCSLVNKEGICHQCASLRQATPEERRGVALPVLSDDPWDSRIAAARKAGIEDGVSQLLHQLLLSRADRINDERCSGHLRDGVEDLS